MHGFLTAYRRPTMLITRPKCQKHTSLHGGTREILAFLHLLLRGKASKRKTGKGGRTANCDADAVRQQRPPSDATHGTHDQSLVETGRGSRGAREDCLFGSPRHSRLRRVCSSDGSAYRNSLPSPKLETLAGPSPKLPRNTTFRHRSFTTVDHLAGRARRTGRI